MRSDRGSVESVGVVTDVGLFLSLLVNQLERLTSPYAVIGHKLSLSRSCQVSLRARREKKIRRVFLSFGKRSNN